MKTELMDASVVILAKAFNPSVLNPAWLVRMNLLREEDLKPGHIFTPVFAQAETSKFAFLLTEDRFQFSPRLEKPKQKELLIRQVGELARALPHTPYIALGLNFSYEMTPTNVAVGELTRDLFYRAPDPLFAMFDAPDGNYGGYFSKDVLGGRLKLDIKPAHTRVVGTPTVHHYLTVEFNFHYDLAPGPAAADQIVAGLQNWNEARQMAEGFIEVLSQRDDK